jgi:hypothetical protein
MVAPRGSGKYSLVVQTFIELPAGGQFPIRSGHEPVVPVVHIVKGIEDSDCRHLAAAVQPVTQAHQRMFPQHARPGVTHDPAHLLAAIALVTMNRTPGTRRFFLAKPAAFQPRVGIIQKLPTVRTQTVARMMPGAAIDTNHGHHRLPFACQPGAGQIISCFGG